MEERKMKDLWVKLQDLVALGLLVRHYVPVVSDISSFPAFSHSVSFSHFSQHLPPSLAISSHRVFTGH